MTTIFPQKSIFRNLTVEWNILDKVWSSKELLYGWFEIKEGHLAQFESIFALGSEDLGLCGLGFPLIVGKKKTYNHFKHNLFPHFSFLEDSERLEQFVNPIFKAKGITKVFLSGISCPPAYLKIWATLIRLTTEGKVFSYKEIAQEAGIPNGARVVGNAMRLNPLAPLIPCHRVLNSGKKLNSTQYFWDPDIKRKLLKEEGIR